MNDTATLPAAASATASTAVGPTRTAAFEKRLAQRYRAERNFRLLGLSAVAFALGVLALLLGNMLINGISGFQRAELAVTIDFPESGVTGDEISLTAPTAGQTLEMQGLPDVVKFYAEEQLGGDAAAELSVEAWRDVAAALAADPSLIERKATFDLPVSSALAYALRAMVRLRCRR